MHHLFTRHAYITPVVGRKHGTYTELLQHNALPFGWRTSSSTRMARQGYHITASCIAFNVMCVEHTGLACHKRTYKTCRPECRTHQYSCQSKALLEIQDAHQYRRPHIRQVVLGRNCRDACRKWKITTEHPQNYSNEEKVFYIVCSPDAGARHGSDRLFS